MCSLAKLLSEGIVLFPPIVVAQNVGTMWGDFFLGVLIVLGAACFIAYACFTWISWALENAQHVVEIKIPRHRTIKLLGLRCPGDFSWVQQF